MRRIVIWLVAGILTVCCTLLAFYPASRLARPLENASNGRLTLLDAEGTIWRGSAALGAAPRANEPLASLLPGRFRWKLSPLALIGRLDLQLENPAVLAQPVMLTGGWREWQFSAGAMNLPADGLAALGAPFNTMGLRGQLHLSWQPLQLTRSGNQLGVNGLMQLEMDNLASRLYPRKSLGSYKMMIDMNKQDAKLVLETSRGPLLLSGAGHVENGHFQFSGKAESEVGHEVELANLLTLLGQPRHEEGRTVIGLEFR